MPNATRKTAAKKSRTRQTARPELLPYPDFPLFPHGSGRWAKKIRGKLYYFGKWDDPDGALKKWESERHDLMAGRTPRVSSDGLTVGALANKFLTTKRCRVDTRELAARTFLGYFDSCKLAVDILGPGRLVDDLAADDFESLRARLSKGRSPVTVGAHVVRLRVLFKYAYDQGLIDRPVRYGQSFNPPTKTTLRRERQKKGPRMFEAAELRRIIKAASVPLKAMILLGINAGMGNADCGQLPLTAVDLKSGWLDYPRPKTAIHRRCWLWPETVAAVGAAIAVRPTPKDESADGLVFVTKYGARWAKERDDLPDAGSLEKGKTTVESPISKAMRKLLIQLGVHRPGVGFYALRHTFETIAGESKDQVAVNHVMGHVDGTMSAEYRERISDDRLKAVADHVRQWLLTEGRGKEKEPKGGWTIEPSAATS